MSGYLTDGAISRLELDRAIVSAIEAEGLVLSPILFDVKRTADTIADGAFCLEMQSQANGQVRQQEAQEVAEQCTVRVLYRIPPLNQHEVRRWSYDAEALVLRGLYRVSNLPKCRVAHRSSTHTVVNDNAFLVTEIRFDITHFQPII